MRKRQMGKGSVGRDIVAPHECLMVVSTHADDSPPVYDQRINVETVASPLLCSPVCIFQPHTGFIKLKDKYVIMFIYSVRRDGSAFQVFQNSHFTNTWGTSVGHFGWSSQL